MMSGRVWMVRYEGDRVSTLRDALGGEDMAEVLYNGTTWRATIVAAASDGSHVDVELWPLDAHTIHPLAGLRELPRPNTVLS